MRRPEEDDDGFMIIAMLGLLTMTAIVTVVLAAVLRSQTVARHDLGFETSLANAEQGLDLMVADVRANPTATTLPARSGAAANGTWSASASGAAGHWVVTSSGVALENGSQVTRVISEHVDVTSLLDVPLWGQHGLTLGSGGETGVDRYDSRLSSTICTGGGSASTMGAAGSHPCNAATPALDRAGTEGALTMRGIDLPKVAGVDIYGVAVPGFPDPDATGTCAGDSTTCAAVGTTVLEHPQQLPHELSNECANGVGAGAGAFDGSFALAAGAVYNFTDVTLNVQAIANLANVSGSQIVICFSGNLTVPPLIPVNSTAGSLLPPSLVPRAPSTLVLISTAPQPTTSLVGGVLQTVLGATPTVNFGVDGLGALLPQSTSISAVVYAPNADCRAAGHLDLYGALICGSIEAPQGVDVHYDAALGSMDFDRRVAVTHWQEDRAAGS